MDRLVHIKLDSNHIDKLNSIFVETHPQGKTKLEIGQSLIFLESVKVGTSFGIYSGNFIPSIGSYSFSHSPFFELIPFEIGNYVSIGEQVCSFGFEHPTDNLGTSPLFYQKDRNLFKRVDINTSKKIINNKGIFIANDVWIGRRAMLKRGIKIGNGAIVGAGSIVTKNVPDYAVVGGNPAKIIKYRFHENIIERLMEIKWWNLPLEELSKVDFNWPILRILETFEESNSFDFKTPLKKTLLLNLLGIKLV
tara:strand:- start:88 stop:837 length:750 start_codon:yes stop_codon:yes gene_type:complete